MATNAISSHAGAQSNEMERAKGALLAINFFMADMQAGIGPFLGVFLQQRSWTSGPSGTVRTPGSMDGMVITAPAGAFTDHTEKKRLVVIVTASAR